MLRASILAALGLAAGLFPATLAAQGCGSSALSCQQLAVQDAQAAGVDPATFVAQIQAESGFNPAALNRGSGAIGIAQFLPSTAANAGFGIAAFNPSDPVAALQAAALYDAALARRDGSLTAALTDYSGGLTPANPASYTQAFAAAAAADAGNPVAVGSTPTATAGGGGGAGAVGAAVGAGAGALTGGLLDQIVIAFRDATGGWEAGLFNIAVDLFLALALIELAAALIIAAIANQGHLDFSVAIVTFLRWLFPIGLFWWLLTHASEYSGDIINSLRQAANSAGGAAITPSAVLTAGINVATAIWSQFASFFHPVTMTVLMLAALVIAICFCLMATWMAAALIEGYFVIGASVLLLAFAGMSWSREIAVALLRFCLGIGMKLFGISMIVGVGGTFVQQWTQLPTDGVSIQTLFTIIGASVFLAAMSKIVPDTMQRLILAAPVSLAHYSPIVQQAAGTAALAAAPVLAAGGFTALAFQAVKHGITETASSNSQSQGALSRAGQLGLGATQALASAAGSEISGRLGGLYRGGVGASATRMASNISQARRVAAAERSRPVPPAP
jgi:type IV secretion system protein TrbL